MPTAIDFSGLEIGNIVVTNEYISEPYNKTFRRKWKCLCKCGKIVWLVTSKLRQEKYKISCGCLYPKLQPGEACLKWLFQDYKRKAGKRALAFKLTISQFKSFVFGNCFYCGIQPQNVVGKSSGRGPIRCNGDILTNGIDRTDNNLGYQWNNCTTCCSTCNRAKFRMTQCEFLDWIKRVGSHNGF